MQYDVKVKRVSYNFKMRAQRVPIKFGREITRAGTLGTVYMTIEGRDGKVAVGVGQMSLAVAWSWPSSMAMEARRVRMEEFYGQLCDAWNSFDVSGHPMEIGYVFLKERLNLVLDSHNREHSCEEPMPYLCALVCNSSFDIALHDAYGNLHQVYTYDTYNGNYMNHDLAWFYNYGEATGPEKDEYSRRFGGKYPCDYLILDDSVPKTLPAWHLVGGVDPLEKSDLTGEEPDDGIPVLLRDWIDRDGLDCLKIKLRGNDAEWDYDRIVHVGMISMEKGVRNLTADFNCTVSDPEYVNAILDRLKEEHPHIWDMILYIEQPFPYDIVNNPIDVHSLSARKPLFMDESAHDWEFVRFGMKLGWNGVALKTCKTMTGALLTMCFSKEFNLMLMVQDLTNPALAMIPHVLLAAHTGTIMGVESNACQYCPGSSEDENYIHPGLYRIKNGVLDLSTIGRIGFGYRLGEILSAKEA